MGLSSTLPVAALLERERALLDGIFGRGAYRIESSRPEHAAVQSNLFELHFGRERDGEIGASISLRNPPAGTSGVAGTWLWARFLGVWNGAKERDRAGRVRISDEEQLRTEIEMIGR